MVFNYKLPEIEILDLRTIVLNFQFPVNDKFNSSSFNLQPLDFQIPIPTIISFTVSDSQQITLSTTSLWPLTRYRLIISDFFSEESEILFLTSSDENLIRDRMIQRYENNIYNFDPETLNYDLTDQEAFDLWKAKKSIWEAKNQNYLSFTVSDEIQTRNVGPFDYLQEESAYQILRVGKEPEGTFVNKEIFIENFPKIPIALQQEEISETLLPEKFKNLILKIKQHNIIDLLSLKFIYSNGEEFNYSISQYGFQLQNARYAKYGKNYFSLQENELRLNDQILDLSSFRFPSGDDRIEIKYLKKDLGQEINFDSLNVYSLWEEIREIIPPITTQFNLKYGHVVSQNDEDIQISGATFLDPITLETHSAFLKEIPFDLSNLPSSAGHYSVDYLTGRVFVYGAKLNDGTGAYPPLASYFHRFYFQPKLDYNFDTISGELVGNSTRNIINQNVKINFSYAPILIPNIDYRPLVHSEVIEERINNHLTSNRSLTVQNVPITNVFRLYNETTGEIYKIERWNDKTVYFSGNINPKIIPIEREKINFNSIKNEKLNIFSKINSFIFSFKLENDKISNSSEDGLGATFNSSLDFSRKDIFITEKYFDSQIDLDLNLNYLSEEGQYIVDYNHGIIYLFSNSVEEVDFGFVNYLILSIKTENNHVLNVNDIYFSTGPNLKTKKINYLSYSDFNIEFQLTNVSDERFNELNQPYTFEQNKIIVQENIFFLRGVYDHYQISNQTNLLNFASVSSFENNEITITSSLQQKYNLIIQPGLILEFPFYSPGIEVQTVISVIRISDGAVFDGTLLSNQTFALSGINSPQVGEEVEVIYGLILNGSSTPIVDYSKGDFFVDYEYLADEILISYEYGPNCLDFSSNTNIFPGEKYYVSYLVGALRESLNQNFGSLVKIPVLQNVNLNLPRERYRDALFAILQAFPKGITLEALKLAVENITHVTPNIKEAAFLLWSLGESNLFPSKIFHSDNLKLLPGKYDFGIQFSNPQEYLEFPFSSHLGLESGTVEFWVTPLWDGLDNLSLLTAELKLNNERITPELIFIGAKSKNPTIDLDGKFSFNKADSIGLPGKIFTEERGYFISFSEEEKKWKLLVKAPTSEVNKFSGQISTSGDFYFVQGIPDLIEISDIIRTRNKKIDFQFFLDAEDYSFPDGYDGYDGYQAGYSFDGLEFSSDEEYYFLDAGNKEQINENRISLYRDGQGYLNFRVLSAGAQRFESKISYDILNWKRLESHFISASWKLNTSEKRDELHLFVDGEEVPNLLRYGGKPEALASDRFRTIIPEILLGTISRPVISGRDLITIAGASSVFSSEKNFSDLGILPGDTISILESGFGTYNILSVNQDTLILNSPLPLSFSNAKFSLNQISFTVHSPIHLVPNFIVSKIKNNQETELSGLRAERPDFSFSRNILDENILTIINGLESGDQVVVRTLGLNFKSLKDEKYIYGPTSLLRTQLPPPVSLNEVEIKKILRKPTQCKVSSTPGLIFTETVSGFSSISNILEGRQIDFSITGQNVNFSSPVNFAISGSNSGGPIIETLQFVEPGKLTTSNKFTIINSVDITFLRWEEKEALVFSCEETYSITKSNGNENYAVTRYSFQTGNGNDLNSISLSEVKDENQSFNSSQIGEKIIISAPISVAGTYDIVNVLDIHTIQISPELPNSFSSGSYKTYSLLDARSGLQNGYFFFQQSGTVNEPFNLSTGYYKIEYPIFLSIPFQNQTGTEKIRFGASLDGKYSANSILDNLIILSSQLTDVRKGEKSLVRNITSDFLSFLSPEVTPDTLTYLNCNSLPVIDQSENWIRKDKKYLQTSTSVNENFDLAINLSHSPLIVENNGYLYPNQGTIEFWISSQLDSFNDKKKRYYFDASSSSRDTIISSSKTKIVLNESASKIISISFINQQPVPGKFELSSDSKTIELQIPLPYFNTPIIVHYISNKNIGNRMSIYKDEYGYLVFEIQSGEKTFLVRRPIFWAQNTWHRVMALYSCNNLKNKDFIRLFVDGEENGNLLFGSGVLFGAGNVFGEKNNLSGLKNNIIFTDNINQIVFGSDFKLQSNSPCSIDNVRLSDIARSPTIISGQAKDLYYNQNLDFCFPVTEDLYTTKIIDFNSEAKKQEDFSLVKNKNFGLSNFEIEVIDSFDIVSSDEKVKKILETIIKLIKPAHTKAQISYFE